MNLPTLNINLGAAVQTMAQAFSASAGIALQADDYVHHEFEEYLKAVDRIAALRRSGRISAEVAQNLLDSRKKSLDSVMQAAKGIKLIAAQTAVNSAIQAINGVIGQALSLLAIAL